MEEEKITSLANEKGARNGVGFQKGSLSMKTGKVVKNNYFHLFEKENSAMTACNIRILQSLGELNSA